MLYFPFYLEFNRGIRQGGGKTSTQALFPLWTAHHFTGDL